MKYIITTADFKERRVTKPWYDYWLNSQFIKDFRLFRYKGKKLWIAKHWILTIEEE